MFTYWGQETHKCVKNYAILFQTIVCHMICPKAIIWTSAGSLSTGPLGTKFSEILINVHFFGWQNDIWKCRIQNIGHFVASMC